jgi:hypothetical protein
MDLRIQPDLLGDAKIASCFHHRVLTRTIGDCAAGTTVHAIFHRESKGGAWRVDLLVPIPRDDSAGELDENVFELRLLEGSPPYRTRTYASRWLNARTMRP